MNFDWSKFTESDYGAMLNTHENDCVGSVYVGDICIELIVDRNFPFKKEGTWHSKEAVDMNFYVAHEDTGYGYKDDVLPYDYAEGFDMDMPSGLAYGEFKEKAEKMFAEYIEAYKGSYSLVEHANRPLEIW